MPYDRLDLHERYCGDIWGEPTAALAAMERIEHRLQRLEVDLGRSPAKNERTGRTVRK